MYCIFWIPAPTSADPNLAGPRQDRVPTPCQQYQHNCSWPHAHTQKNEQISEYVKKIRLSNYIHWVCTTLIITLLSHFIHTIYAWDLFALLYHRRAISPWQTHFSPLFRHSCNYFIFPKANLSQITLKYRIHLYFLVSKKGPYCCQEMSLSFQGLMIVSVSTLSEFIMWHWQMHSFSCSLVWFNNVRLSECAASSFH